VRAVLHVLEAVEGGTARHVVDVVSTVPGWEHHVALPERRVGAPTDRLAAARLRDAGAVLHVIDMRRAPWHPANARAVARLRRLRRQVRPAIVHGHSSIGAALGRLAVVGTEIPFVHTPNALAAGRLVVTAERLLGRRTTRLVAVSPSEAAHLRRLGLVPDDRVVTIPNGVALPAPPPALDLRERLGLDAGVPLVGTVGRLIDQKAPERFLEVCAAVSRLHPDARFLLVGDGPLRPAVEAHPARHELGGRLHHLVELPDAGSVLGQLDVFVLASRFEGGPYAPLEAMRAGTAVVLTDVVGNRDAVVDGESGVLVEQDDVAGLAARVAELLADGDRRRVMGEAAQRRVAAEFDRAVAGRRLAALYEEVAGA
jgi:glycosyltransferase involved in cell wall biosynthesis